MTLTLWEEGIHPEKTSIHIPKIMEVSLPAQEQQLFQLKEMMMVMEIGMRVDLRQENGPDLLKMKRFIKRLVVMRISD